mgnify:CR=1 FL=1
MIGEKKESAYIVEQENMNYVEEKPISIMGNKDVFVPVQAKRCKGPGYEHYILPAYHGPKINEILGYCKPCWIRQLIADNYYPSTPNKPLKGGGKNATFINNETL